MLTQPYGLFVSNGSQGGGQVHSPSRAHKLAHACHAGIRHLRFSRQLHSSRHDFRPNWLQVTRALRMSVCEVHASAGQHAASSCWQWHTSAYPCASTAASRFSPTCLKFTVQARGVQVQPAIEPTHKGLQIAVPHPLIQAHTPASTARASPVKSNWTSPSTRQRACALCSAARSAFVALLIAFSYFTGVAGALAKGRAA